ncbi:glutamate-cysteine ligase family protein [Rhizohabitans arisaemae]|uniref:glutamate-cysteine ligase family protein n=1 Tax=Rhizohabitans arisaemae TaxID=2720610 RepID=UPI0024B11EC4|nr:glutamate-cysteine ligase family protein [Rhizohabitans arisaemae]
MLTERTAASLIYDNAFSRDQVGRIGVELEWLVVDQGFPQQRVPIADIRSCLGFADEGPLPQGGLISYEPGGQLELSSAPADTLAGCLDAAASDLALIRDLLGRRDLTLVGRGLDDRPAVLVNDLPRYRTLEQNYNRFGPSGKIIMCNAAAIQINVEAGDASPGWRGWRRRWWLANTLGPILMAMFANSPVSTGGMAHSARQIHRFQADPYRTAPLSLLGDPRENWMNYVLDAPLLDGSGLGSTMREWLRGGGSAGVSPEELDLHVRSMVPPVRPRGYLELRMIDAQRDDNWVVPLIVVSRLLDDALASAEAMRVVESLPQPLRPEDWVTAAREAMRDARLAEAAGRCMSIAIDALGRCDVPLWARRLVLDFADTYTFRSRCPADDLLVEEAA